MPFKCRSKRKYAGLDEYSATSKAMEDVGLFNGLECKIACNSSKVYLLPRDIVTYGWPTLVCQMYLSWSLLVASKMCDQFNLMPWMQCPQSCRGFFLFFERNKKKKSKLGRGLLDFCVHCGHTWFPEPYIEQASIACTTNEVHNPCINMPIRYPESPTDNTQPRIPVTMYKQFIGWSKV